MRPRLFRQRCRGKRGVGFLYPGTASYVALGQGGNCWAAFSPQRWIWFQGCGSKTGKRSPYLETFSSAAARDSPAPEPPSPRLRFPAGERRRPESFSPGATAAAPYGFLTSIPHQRFSSNQSNRRAPSACRPDPRASAAGDRSVPVRGQGAGLQRASSPRPARLTRRPRPSSPAANEGAHAR